MQLFTWTLRPNSLDRRSSSLSPPGDRRQGTADRFAVHTQASPHPWQQLQVSRSTIYTQGGPQLLTPVAFSAALTFTFTPFNSLPAQFHHWTLSALSHPSLLISDILSPPTTKTGTLTPPYVCLPHPVHHFLAFIFTKNDHVGMCS